MVSVFLQNEAASLGGGKYLPFWAYKIQSVVVRKKQQESFTRKLDHHPTLKLQEALLGFFLLGKKQHF